MDNTIRQIAMRKATATAAMLALSLTACSPPNPISDAQAKLIVEQCAAKGYATRISNSRAVSRIECVEAGK